MAEFVMVDEVLVAERDADDALHQQGLDACARQRPDRG